MLQKLKSAYFDAMRNKDALSKGVLSLVINRAESLLKTKGSLTDEDVIAQIKAEIKQINDTLDGALAANRDDLIANERKKIALLETFIPKQLNETEILELLKSKGATSEMNIGQLMGLVMSTHKQVVDGKTVNKVIRENFM